MSDVTALLLIATAGFAVLMAVAARLETRLVRKELAAWRDLAERTNNTLERYAAVVKGYQEMQEDDDDGDETDPVNNQQRRTNDE